MPYLKVRDHQHGQMGELSQIWYILVVPTAHNSKYAYDYSILHVVAYMYMIDQQTYMYLMLLIGLHTIYTTHYIVIPTVADRCHATSRFRFPFSNFQFPFSNFRFPISIFRFPISIFQLQFSNFQFPFFDFQLPFSFPFSIYHYNLPNFLE